MILMMPCLVMHSLQANPGANSCPPGANIASFGMNALSSILPLGVGHTPASFCVQGKQCDFVQRGLSAVPLDLSMDCTSLYVGR